MKDKQKKPAQKGENMISEVVRAEAVGLYPSNETDEGLTPRSRPESRAGIDAEGEGSK